LLTVLLLGNGAASPLVIAYPLIIVGSSLWFRRSVRLVHHALVGGLLRRADDRFLPLGAAARCGKVIRGPAVGRDIHLSCRAC